MNSDSIDDYIIMDIWKRKRNERVEKKDFLDYIDKLISNGNGKKELKPQKERGNNESL